MQLSRLLDGRVPMIMNVVVFSATAINEGAVLITGATTTAQGAIVSVNNDTTDLNGVIGVTQVGSSLATQSKENNAPNSHAYSIPTSGFPNTGTTTTVGMSMLPLCVNPEATYFALYSTTTASGTASDTCGTWTAGTSTAASRGTTGLDVLGGWLFSLGGVNSAGATPTFSGSLRYISNQSATTSVTLLTAMNISTDSHMIWVDRTWKKGGILNTTADKLRSVTYSSATVHKLNGARMAAIENYINADHAPIHPLRKHVDNGLDGLTGVKLYSEVVFSTPFLQDLA